MIGSGANANVYLACGVTDTHWFMSLDDARVKMAEWLQDYNEVRPHSAVGNKPPISLVNCSDASGPL